MTNDYGNLELHKTLLSAMIDFDGLCSKYNLKYCLHGGTCLGAIRHKGFIPWDDDVDIIMLRKDYDKFTKVAQKEWGEKYFIQNYKTESMMNCNVTKIRINNSNFIAGDSNTKNKNAFLDIFPMNDIPNSVVLQKIQNKLVIFFNMIVMTKIGEILPTSIISKITLKSLSFLPKRFIGGILEILIKYFPHINSKYVNIVATANYLDCTGYANDITPKCFFENLHRTEFENCMFWITDYWDKYLTNKYGDYMKLPEENNRINKHNMKSQEEQ